MANSCCSSVNCTKRLKKWSFIIKCFTCIGYKDGRDTECIVNDEYRTYDIFPAGRLDIDTEGLLLLTNDGILSHNLLSPKKHVDKKYYVKIAKPLSENDVKTLENGIKLEENFVTKKAKVEVISENLHENGDNQVYITISEGKFHQVKRMVGYCGKEVVDLQRLTMGTLVLDENLQRGEWRRLTKEELEDLRASIA